MTKVFTKTLAPVQNVKLKETSLNRVINQIKVIVYEHPDEGVYFKAHELAKALGRRHSFHNTIVNNAHEFNGEYIYAEGKNPNFKPSCYFRPSGVLTIIKHIRATKFTRELFNFVTAVQKYEILSQTKETFKVISESMNGHSKPEEEPEVDLSTGVDFDRPVRTVELKTGEWDIEVGKIRHDFWLYLLSFGLGYFVSWLLSRGNSNV